MRSSINLGLALVVIGVIAGCSSPSEPGHTHLWVGDQQHNVWSYLRVETYTSVEDSENAEVFGEDAALGEFFSQKMSAGDVVTFPGDVEVKCDGTSLWVNGDKIEVKHVQVEANGRVRKNAYIKTGE